MDEFQNQIHQLRISCQQLENFDINELINEIEQIGLFL